MKEKIGFLQADKREKDIPGQESPMSKHRKTWYSLECPGKSQEPGVYRGPKDGVEEQRPKGRAFGRPGSLDFVLWAVGKLSEP